MSSEIVKNQDTGGLIVANHAAMGGSMQLGRMAMWNDSPTEKKKYPLLAGKAQPGDWFDVLEQRPIGKTVKIVPLWVETTWVKWPKGQKTPTYVEKFIRNVPPEDLEWNENAPNPEDRAPKAAETWTYIVLVEGEPFPFRVAFKRTSLKVGRSIYELEQRRAARKVGRGTYALGSKDDKNASNQDYLRVQVGPAGDVPPSLTALVNETVAQIKTLAAEAAKADDEGDSEVPF